MTHMHININPTYPYTILLNTLNKVSDEVKFFVLLNYLELPAELEKLEPVHKEFCINARHIVLSNIKVMR